MNMDHQAVAKWIGQWELVITDTKTGKVKSTEVIKPNLITDAGLNMMRDLLRGTITDGKIKYVALGDGATAPAVGQTKLVNERFRKIVTSQNPDAVTAGKLYTEVYISDVEGNGFTCEEMGWFAGAGASGSTDSGIMVARVLYSKEKSATESWTIRRTDTIARG
jgi:hypothetical protein